MAQENRTSEVTSKKGRSQIAPVAALIAAAVTTVFCLVSHFNRLSAEKDAKLAALVNTLVGNTKKTLDADGVVTDRDMLVVELVREDLQKYEGQPDKWDERNQNIIDFETAKKLRLSFYNAQVIEVEEEKPRSQKLYSAAADLGKDAVVGILNFVTDTRLSNVIALIDDRDPALGPVFIYRGLESSYFDGVMQWMRDHHFDTQGGISAPAMTFVLRDLGSDTLRFLKVTKDNQKDAQEYIDGTPWEDLIKKSLWNPKLEVHEESWTAKLKFWKSSDEEKPADAAPNQP